MKTRQTKTARIEVVEIRPKETKAKSLQYQRTNKLVHLRKKSVLEDLIMSSSCSSTKNVQDVLSGINSMLSEQLDNQCNIKRKMKMSCSSNTKASNSTDSCLDSTEASTSADTNSKRCRAIVNQRRSLGSPVIVEALSGTLPAFRIPKILRQNHELRNDDDACDTLPQRTRRSNSRKAKASIIVANCASPSLNPDTQGNDTTTVAPSKTNRKPRYIKSPLTSKNDNASDTWETNEPSVSFEGCLENLGIDATNSNVPNASIKNSTPKRNRSDVQANRCPVQFYCLKNKIVAILPGRTQFCFTGKIVLKVMFGAVEVYGSLITATTKPMEIYSPRGYSSVCIKASDWRSQDVQPDIWASLSAEGINRDIENKLVADLNNLKAGTTVLLLSSLENKLTKFLNAFYPFRLFPSIKNTPYQSWMDPKRAEAILQSNLYVDSYACKEMVVDHRVTQDVAGKMLTSWRANKRSCTLIAGGKNVGKSTSVRCLINSLLPVSKMVVLVDFDPGQAECTPAGCISYSLIEEPLLGPNFTHLKNPVFQLYLGDIDVSRCITKYIEGMKMLVDRLWSCPMMSRLPIVVNTMGFTRGLGWDIMVFTVKLLQPSLVVQIMSEKVRNNYPHSLSSGVINKQKFSRVSWSMNDFNWNQNCDHELFMIRTHAERKSAPVNETWNMEPYQQRELVLISYLSEIMRGPIDPTCCTNSLSLNEAMPYVTPFSSIIVSIPRASAPPTHVLSVINGNIVALCGIDLQDPESQPTDLVSGLRVLDRSPLCSCYGFGIVRGVDTEREEVFINTPQPAWVMQYVNCLVGCIPVPVTLLQLNQQRNVPYTGGTNELPTSREYRRGYFRMRYQRANANS
ncbi:polynucleotide 5'-hydroxyl-kinase NOL9 [Lasioglossum baleicum]|uniref:polynucleotide 5'-hydroxyl-kinase NOL9 n=1 Tax=Lasioglossum baleicum TaxID=434251 RepID=UPI003FCD5F52